MGPIERGKLKTMNLIMVVLVRGTKEFESEAEAEVEVTWLRSVGGR